MTPGSQSGAHVEWVAELVLRPGGLDLPSGLRLHSLSHVRGLQPHSSAPADRGPQRETKAMNIFFSPYLDWVPWERGSLGWLNGRDGG